MTKKPAAWFVYILECANGRLYTGITTDVQSRFEKHCAGKGAMFTRLNRPLKILGAKSFADRSTASKAEWTTKQLSAPQKKVLAAEWLSAIDNK